MIADVKHTMIELDRLTVRCPGRLLLEDVNARYREGELVSLMGRNGSGKSTLLRTIGSLRRPDSGHILFNGKDLSSISREFIAREISFVTTSRVRVNNMTCSDIVALGRTPYTGWTGKLSQDDESKIDLALAKTELTALAHRDINTLSDGEMQRVMIARALAQDTPVMLLDEPTSFLDVPSRHQVIELLSKLAHEENKCIIFSTHEIDIAMHYCDVISLIETPSMLTAPTDEVIASGAINQAFGVQKPHM